MLDAPEAEADAGETPDQNAAPVATVADFVEDPSAADKQADLSALTEAVAAPEVATDVNAPDEAPETATLAMPGLTGMDTINQAPRAPALNRPPSPVQAPRIAGTESPKPTEAGQARGCGAGRDRADRAGDRDGGCARVHRRGTGDHGRDAQRAQR